MPVPKRKKSKSRRDMRRSWHQRVTVGSGAKCPQCHEAKLPHRVCPHCGYYKGQEIIRMDEE